MSVIEPERPGLLIARLLNETDQTVEALAAKMIWSVDNVNRLITGEMAISASIALILADVFSNSPEFWLKLQSQWDLWEAKKNHAPVSYLEPFDGLINDLN